MGSDDVLEPGASRTRRRNYLKRVRVAGTMLDGPRSPDEIPRLYFGYLRPFGLFLTAERRARARESFVREKLEELLALGWVVPEGERYALTPPGREHVERRLSALSETGAAVRRFLEPQVVAKVTVAVHFGLAALKLPAGLLSGSVGMLNDAADTFLDGLAGVLVYLGLRFQKEAVVNPLLVLFMLATGCLTLYQALRRFFAPVELEPDWFTFLAVLSSAVAAAGLWAYQRYVGLRSGHLALIAQSVDSRNHVVVAVGVAAGLVASVLDFSLLDTLVGLAVALVILKSGIDLAIETLRSMREGATDLSRYEFWLAGQYDQFRQAQLLDWMLYLVHVEGVTTRTELTQRATETLDFNRIPAIRAMGPAQRRAGADEMIERSLAELFERGWLTGEEPIEATADGSQRLRRRWNDSITSRSRSKR